MDDVILRCANYKITNFQNYKIQLLKMVRVAVALGSNLGDRAAHLAFARVRLNELLRGAIFSFTFETDPVGVPGTQGRFLNAAAVGETDLAPEALLAALLAIERERGRERPFANAPRTLDLDLILYGDRIVETPDLVLPHPRFRERAFVLEPLTQIAPAIIDPVTRRTVAELALLVRNAT